MTQLENEQELIAQAVAGDLDILGRLLEAYAPELRKRLAGKIATRWQALLSDDDVLQQTFADAFVGIKRFQYTGPHSFLAWLSRIAQHNLHDAVKHLQAAKTGGQQHQLKAGSDESYHRLMHNLADSISTPSIKAARVEVRGELRAAIERLPTAYREIVFAYDIEGENVEVLAERLGCSVGALYMRRSRAHDLLAKWLADQSPGPGTRQ